MGWTNVPRTCLERAVLVPAKFAHTFLRVGPLALDLLGGLLVVMPFVEHPPVRGLVPELHAHELGGCPERVLLEEALYDVLRDVPVGEACRAP